MKKSISLLIILTLIFTLPFYASVLSDGAAAYAASGSNSRRDLSDLPPAPGQITAIGDAENATFASVSLRDDKVTIYDIYEDELDEMLEAAEGKASIDLSELYTKPEKLVIPTKYILQIAEFAEEGSLELIFANGSGSISSADILAALENFEGENVTISLGEDGNLLIG